MTNTWTSLMAESVRLLQLPPARANHMAGSPCTCSRTTSIDSHTSSLLSCLPFDDELNALPTLSLPFSMSAFFQDFVFCLPSSIHTAHKALEGGGGVVMKKKPHHLNHTWFQLQGIALYWMYSDSVGGIYGHQPILNSKNYLGI